MPIEAYRTNKTVDEGEDIMPDVGPDAAQRARMRKPRASASKTKPDFKDEAFAKGIFDRFNSKRDPKPQAEDGDE